MGSVLQAAVADHATGLLPLLLLLQGSAFELVNVDLSDKPAWYRRVHPGGLVPALVHGQETHIESLDICRRAKNRAWKSWRAARLAGVHMCGRLRIAQRASAGAPSPKLLALTCPRVRALAAAAGLTRRCLARP